MNNTQKLIGLNNWNSDKLDLKLEYFPQNVTYDYKTFDILNNDIKNTSDKIQLMRSTG